MKKKIAHLSNYDRGITVFLMPQLKALQSAGYEVHAIFPFGDQVDLIKAEGIIPHHLEVGRDISFFNDILLLFRLYAIMRKERFFMVHAHSAKLEFFGQLAAWLAGVQWIIYTNHGIIFRSPYMGKAKRYVLKSLARLSGKISHVIFSQSREDIDYLVKHKIYNSKKLLYLGNGINIKRFTPQVLDIAQKQQKKRSLGVPEGKIIIGIVGRFVFEKGYREFLEASRLILESRNDVFFLCIGNSTGNERDPVDFDIELSKNEKLNQNLLILSSRDDMPELYALIDIMVLPSHREGFPRALMEGAASGCALIASNISGCREVVEHGVNGFLFETGNVSNLKSIMEELLNDADLRIKMGQAGREKALREFDENKVIARLLAGIDSLIK